MNHGLTRIGDIFGDFHIIQKPDLRNEPKTPNPVKQKVVSHYPRTPINKQAALIIARAPYWAKLDPSLHPSSISIKSKPETYEENLSGKISILKHQVTNLNNIINKLKLLNENLKKENESQAALISSLESDLAEYKRRIGIAKKTLPFI